MSLKTVQLVKYKDHLDSLFEKGSSLSDDPELLANWAKYLCVLVSGFVEESVRVLVINYAESRAAPEIGHFVGCRIRKFQNPKMSNILTLLGGFSEELRSQIESATEGELKDAVDSVVQNRHLIAHGRSVGISFVTIRDYYKRILSVVEHLEIALDS